MPGITGSQPVCRAGHGPARVWRDLTPIFPNDVLDHARPRRPTAQAPPPRPHRPGPTVQAPPPRPQREERQRTRNGRGPGAGRTIGFKGRQCRSSLRCGRCGEYSGTCNGGDFTRAAAQTPPPPPPPLRPPLQITPVLTFPGASLSSGPAGAPARAEPVGPAGAPAQVVGPLGLNLGLSLGTLGLSLGTLGLSLGLCPVPCEPGPRARGADVTEHPPGDGIRAPDADVTEHISFGLAGPGRPGEGKSPA
eukprot:gene8726-biopygen16655